MVEYVKLGKQLKNDLTKKPLKEAVEDPNLPICWKGAKPFKSLLDVKKFFGSLILNFVNGRKAAQLEIPPENYLVITVSILPLEFVYKSHVSNITTYLFRLEIWQCMLGDTQWY